MTWSFIYSFVITTNLCGKISDRHESYVPWGPWDSRFRFDLISNFLSDSKRKINTPLCKHHIPTRTSTVWLPTFSAHRYLTSLPKRFRRRKKKGFEKKKVYLKKERWKNKDGISHPPTFSLPKSNPDDDGHCRVLGNKNSRPLGVCFSFEIKYAKFTNIPLLPWVSVWSWAAYFMKTLTPLWLLCFLQRFTNINHLCRI